LSTLDTIVQRRVLYALAVESAKYGFAPEAATVARAAGVALTLALAVLWDAERSGLVRKDTLYGSRELTEKGIHWLRPEAFGGRTSTSAAIGSSSRDHSRNAENEGVSRSVAGGPINARPRRRGEAVA
jgi:hypothetical protein